MKVQLSKWGNSLGLRLPKAVADELALKPGQTLELTIGDGAVELRARAKRPRYKLEDLLAEIKPGDQPPPLEDWGILPSEWPVEDWSDVAPEDDDSDRT